jgi:oxygen-independent coproporphyrinogen-3 oxidase
MARVAAIGEGTAERTVVSPTDAPREALLMGMRLAAGISPARFRRVTGMDLDAALDPRGLARVEAGGFVVRDRDGGIAATPAGQRVLDAVLAEIVR